MKTIKFKPIGNMFPLYRKSDLAKRWGVDIRRLDNWEKRHEDFPPRVEGVLAGEFPIYGSSDVAHYENTRGGSMKVADHNAALGNR